MTARRKKLTQADESAALDYFTDEVLDGRREGDTRWRRGESGNPRGRPIQPITLTDTLLWRLGRSGARDLADKLIELAKAGNLQAIQYIYDRIEGKPRQQLTHTDESEPAIVKVLRKLATDQTALDGHRFDGVKQLPEPSLETEVRTTPSD